MRGKAIACELYNDNFQNFSRYQIPHKAQLVIADIPYNIGVNAYGSSPEWYIAARLGKHSSTRMSTSISQSISTSATGS